MQEAQNRARHGISTGWDKISKQIGHIRCSMADKVWNVEGWGWAYYWRHLICSMIPIGPAPFGRPGCLGTLCDFSPRAFALKCSQSYNQFCSHSLYITCNFPYALPSDTTSQSFCKGFPWSLPQWGVPWLPYTPYKSSWDGLLESHHQRQLWMLLEVGHGKPQHHILLLCTFLYCYKAFPHRSCNAWLAQLGGTPLEL